jgi:alpha-amylase
VVTVDASGNASITVAPFRAAAIHVRAKLGGTTPGTVAVTFNEAADTVWGQNIYVVGSVPALASWSPASAVPMTWISGSGTRGNWRTTVNLPASTAVEYKYIKKDGSGNVIWESGANRTLTTGAGGSAQSTSDSWK